ncbi:MAG: MFS transporter [Rhodospirillaceae bacterium]|nr:MFS transporter [Rhodospirillaceae bacterium]
MNSSQKRRLPFYYGWVVVAVAFITMGVGVNARTAFSLLFPPILDEFGWSRGSLAATFSIGFMVSALITPLIGIMMDKHGPRLVLPIGAALVGTGLMLTTFAVLPWHFYLTLGVMVVGGSIFISYIGHTLFLPNWFIRRRGLALGLAFAGVGIGSVTIFPWMQHSIDTVGWRESCWVLAFIILLVLVPLNITFQRRRPEDMGLLPDGDKVPDATSERDNGEVVDRTIVDKDWVATDWTLAKAMRPRRFWWLMLSFICTLYAWYAVQVHQTRYLIDVGITAETAALALGLVGLAGVMGQIVVGHLSDRMGREWAYTLALLGFLSTYGCLYLLRQWPEVWLMYLMIGLQGFLGYGVSTVFAATPADLFAGKHYGAIFGVLATAASAGAALGPWTTGIFFDIWGDYDLAFTLAMVLCLLAIATMWIAAPRKVRLVQGQVRGQVRGRAPSD